MVPILMYLLMVVILPSNVDQGNKNEISQSGSGSECSLPGEGLLVGRRPAVK